MKTFICPMMEELSCCNSTEQQEMLKISKNVENVKEEDKKTTENNNMCLAYVQYMTECCIWTSVM